MLITVRVSKVGGGCELNCAERSFPRKSLNFLLSLLPSFFASLHSIFWKGGGRGGGTLAHPPPSFPPEKSVRRRGVYEGKREREERGMAQQKMEDGTSPPLLLIWKVTREDIFNTDYIDGELMPGKISLQSSAQDNDLFISKLWKVSPPDFSGKLLSHILLDCKVGTVHV